MSDPFLFGFKESGTQNLLSSFRRAKSRKGRFISMARTSSRQKQAEGGLAADKRFFAARANISQGVCE
jgi:hypothetical protein